MNTSTAYQKSAASFWLSDNARNFVGSFVTIFKRPVASLLTLLVLAIGLALPTVLAIFTLNVQETADNIDYDAKITLFLQPYITNNEQSELAKRILSIKSIDYLNIITPEEGLKEFSAYSGIPDLASTLLENPLPPVIEISPKNPSPKNVAALSAKFEKLDVVDIVKSDVQWIERLQRIISIARNSFIILFSALCLLVIITLFNTIRLLIENRRLEILVTRLVGGTKTYIRRPFLYVGFWYGLIAALLALGLSFAAIRLAKEPIDALVNDFAADVTLTDIPLTLPIVVIFTGIALGIMSAWFASSWQINRIQNPR